MTCHDSVGLLKDIEIGAFVCVKLSALGESFADIICIHNSI